MSVTAAIRKLLADGFTMEQALAAAEAFEAEMVPQRTARQERNARYYASKKRLKAPETSNSDASVLNKTPLARVEENPSSSEISGQKEKISSPAKRGTRIPDDFEPDIGWAVAHGLSFNAAQTEAAQFLDYWRAKAGKDGLKADWKAAWRTWVRNAIKRSAQSPPRGARRNFADVAMDRMNGHGSEGIFGGDSDAQRLPARIGEPGPDDGNIRSGIARRFGAGGH